MLDAAINRSNNKINLPYFSNKEAQKARDLYLLSENDQEALQVHKGYHYIYAEDMNLPESFVLYLFSLPDFFP